MKKLKWILASIGFALFATSCGNSPQNTVYVTRNTPQTVSVQSNNVPGFDIEQFAYLLKSTANPDLLTQAINTPGNGINMLDLDNDGSVDYLRVDQIDENTLVVVNETGDGVDSRITICTLLMNNDSYRINGTSYCSAPYYQSPYHLRASEYAFLNYTTERRTT